MKVKIWFKYPLLAAILLMIFVTACTNDGLQMIGKPASLVSKKQMAAVLVDLHITEAGLSSRNLLQDSLKKANAAYYDFILKKNELDAASFEKSYEYYLSVPAEMDTIYTYVVDELSNRELKNKVFIPKPENDTIPKSVQSVIINP